MLSALRVEWLRLIHDWHLVPRLLKAVAERSKDAWLSEEEVHILREVLVSFLRSRGLKCSAAIEPGQPLALELWEGLFSLCGDVDQQLPSLLREGVPTGILRTIPPSGVWRETEVPEHPNLELHTFDTPWGSARGPPRLGHSVGLLCVLLLPSCALKFGVCAVASRRCLDAAVLWGRSPAPLLLCVCGMCIVHPNTMFPVSC